MPGGDFITRLTSFQTDVAFSSKLSWVTRIQYDNVSEIMGVNLRLHWVPEAGREGFFVLNHDLEDRDLDNRFHSGCREAAVKIQLHVPLLTWLPPSPFVAPRKPTRPSSSRKARRSRALHHPWIKAPATAAQFRRYLARIDGERNHAWLVCARRTGNIVGVINVSETVLGAFRSAYLGYYVFAGFERQGLMRAGLACRRSPRVSHTAAASARGQHSARQPRLHRPRQSRAGSARKDIRAAT